MNKEAQTQEEKQVSVELKMYNNYLKQLEERTETLFNDLGSILYFRDALAEEDEKQVYDHLCPLAADLAGKNLMFAKLLVRLLDINNAIEL
jgi:hypothetical protein